MSRYLLQHRHAPEECGVVFASFKGHESPLRHRTTLASCPSGGHAIWWTKDADSEEDALRLLPFYLAERTTVTRVSEVQTCSVHKVAQQRRSWHEFQSRCVAAIERKE